MAGKSGVVAKYIMDETELVKHAIAAYCHGRFVTGFDESSLMSFRSASLESHEDGGKSLS